MTEPARPCCRALVVASVAAHAVAVVVAVIAPAATSTVLATTTPFLCFAWLAPGLLLTPFVRPRATAPERLLLGAGFAAVVHMAVIWTTPFIARPESAPLAHHALIGAWIAALGLRLWINPPPDVRRRDADDRAALTAAGAVLVAGLIVALPALQSDLMSDGVESFEMGRSLATHAFPRSPGGTGLVGLGVGMITQAYPARWFDLVFPDQDVAPRLPFVLFLPLVFAGVIALAEVGGARRLGPLGLTAIALTTLTFGVALGLNVGFDPYGVELSSPGALDVMTALLLLGVAWAAFSPGDAVGTATLLAFAALAHFARPSGLLLLLCLGAFGAVLRPRGARAAFVVRIAAALALCAVLGFLYERVYATRIAPEGAGLSSASLPSRLRYLTFTDVGRLLFVALPTGFLGVFALFAWRRQDATSRVLSAASIATAGLFYVQASYSPHHFAPAMVLPVAVLHRVLGSRTSGPSTAVGCGVVACALGALALAWPSGGFEPVRPFRALGGRILFEGPDPRASLDEALLAADRLGPLLAPCHADVDPAVRLMGSPLSLARYARRSGPVDAEVDFVVRRASAPPPAGFVRHDDDAAPDAFALYVRSPAALERARTPTAPTGYASRLLAVDRRLLFRSRVIRDGLYDLDVKTLFGGGR